MNECTAKITASDADYGTEQRTLRRSSLPYSAPPSRHHISTSVLGHLITKTVKEGSKGLRETSSSVLQICIRIKICSLPASARLWHPSWVCGLVQEVVGGQEMRTWVGRIGWDRTGWDSRIRIWPMLESVVGWS